MSTQAGRPCIFDGDLLVVPGLTEPSRVGGIKKLELVMEPSMLLAPTDEQYPREELLFVEPTNELLLFFLCVQSFGILKTHLLW
jgi:hypothetical protein